MSEHNGEHSNAELMRLMGSKNGSDPIPPSQYLCFLTDKDPRQKMLAYVRSTTIRQGHRSPFCVDKEGNTITLSHIAAYFKWDLGFTCRIWSQLETMKLVAKDKQNRLCLCGNVPDLVPPSAEKDELDCTVNLPPYILRQINKLTPVLLSECKRKLTAFYKFSDELEAEAIAAARAIAEPFEAKLFAEFDLYKKPGKKRRKIPLEVTPLGNGAAPAAKSETVQLTLLTVPNFDVQSTDDAVQSDDPPVYNGENGTVQAAPTYISSEVHRSENSAAASSVSDHAAAASPNPTATIIAAVKKLGDLSPSKARELQRDSRGLTVKELVRKIAAIVFDIEQQRERISIPSPVGLLLQKLEAFFQYPPGVAEWHRECEEADAKEAAEELRQEERRQQDEKRAEELERSLAEPVDDAEARKRYDRMQGKEKSKGAP